MEHEICTGQQTIACEICSINFTSKDLFDKHAQKCLKKTTFTCEVCYGNYASKKYLNKHMRQRHRMSKFKPFPCGICYRNCRSKDSLDNHMYKYHSGMKTLTCEICNKNFSHESLFMRHLKYHSEKPYGCEKCCYRFTDESKLREHLERHSGEFLHVCEVCNRKCKTKQDLMIHKYAHEGKRKVVVKAETDNATYSQLMRKNSNTYVKRTKNAPDENPYVCEICNKGCKTNADLMIHKHIHEEVRVKIEKEKIPL